MSSKSTLTKLLRFFDYPDDGSLPEFILSGLTQDSLLQAFELFITHSSGPDKEKTVWVEEQKRDIPFGEFQSTKELFTVFLTHPQFMNFRDLTFQEVKLPEILVCLYPRDGELEISYQTGKEWNQETLNALILLLKKIKEFAPTLSIYIPHEGESIYAGTNDAEEFQNLMQSLANQ